MLSKQTHNNSHFEGNLMTKPLKSSVISTYFDQIVASILDQKEKIRNLQLLKNEALLNTKNYQNDIDLLKSCILELRERIKPGSKPVKNIPLQQTTPLVNHTRKNLIFTIGTIQKIQAKEIVCSVKYSKNGYFFAFATYKTLYLYDANTKQCINNTNIPFDANGVMEKLTRTLVISPNSSTIALCAADFSIVLYKVPTLKFIGKIQSGSSTAAYMCFFNDGVQIATSGSNGEVSVWSVATLSKEKSFSLGPGKNIVSISITSDDNTLFIACSDGSVYLYDTHKDENPTCVQESDDFVFSACLSNSSTQFAVSLRNNDVKLYTLLGGFRLLKNFSGHNDYVVCVEFSVNGRVLFTGSKDETIKIWDVETGNMLTSLPLCENTVFCISHHPLNNEFVACTGDGIISVITYMIQH